MSQKDVDDYWDKLIQTTSYHEIGYKQMFH